MVEQPIRNRQVIGSSPILGSSLLEISYGFSSFARLQYLLDLTAAVAEVILHAPEFAAGSAGHEDWPQVAKIV